MSLGNESSQTELSNQNQALPSERNAAIRNRVLEI